ncbi:MAG: hypothetical protein CMJ08_05425 [Pelagibacterales bacterium]|nr:hypothetical protein [Pelagibacterales bacterium]|tara:strand:+ start:156 stop:626 length:471 start_codon:yes stop_codon:yes gene_type:complete
MNNIISKTILFYFLVVFNLVSKNKEIEITATSMEWKKEESIAIATGDAKAIQGTTILYANKIIVFFDKEKDFNSIKKLDASGNVKFIRENQIATGNNAVYFVENEKIFIKGNVTLQREDSMMLGDELSIDLKTSSSKLTSKNNEKVRAKYNTDRVD